MRLYYQYELKHYKHDLEAGLVINLNKEEQRNTFFLVVPQKIIFASADVPISYALIFVVIRCAGSK
jgi:hypothetical protein